jgi:hypothetical protein
LLLLALWLGGCTRALLPVPPGARAVWAFEVETYLGRVFSEYATTLLECRARRRVEIAYQTATRESNPERFPFYRTTVLNECYPATLQDGGYGWGVEAQGTWGAVMPSAGLCDGMRDTLVPSVPRGALTECVPVTLTPR